MPYHTTHALHNLPRPPFPPVARSVVRSKNEVKEDHGGVADARRHHRTFQTSERA